MSLVDVPSHELQTLRARIARSELECPLSADFPSLSALARHAPELFGHDRAATLALIDAVLAERQRPRPVLELVWTGPDPKVSLSRDTAAVVREMFASARKSVLVAGYSFDHGHEILKPLYEAMCEHKFVAELFLDIPRAESLEAAEKHVTRFVDGFLNANWPFESPEPHIYYDPRTVWGEEYASIHAKCVVVDEHAALVGSANFTGRGQTRNIEVGVRIDDEQFAKALLYQWRQVIQNRLVQRAH